MEKNLNSIVQNMIDAGESEENIGKVIKHFNSQPQGGIKVVDLNKKEAAQDEGPGMVENAVNAVTNIPVVGSAIKGLASISPGKVLGEGIGNSVEGINAALHGDFDKAHEMAQMNFKNVPRMAADTANAMYTAGSSAIAPAKTAMGRIAANAGMGFASGTASGYANGKDLGEASRDGAIVGTLSGTVSGVAEGVGALVRKSPKWLLENTKGITDPDEVAKHLSYGSTDKLTNKYQKGIEEMGQQIDDEIGHHTPWGNVQGDYEGMGVVHKTIADNSDANLHPMEFVDKIKKLIPEKAVQMDRLVNGQATLMDKSQIRQALNKVNEKAYDAGELAGTFNKRLAQSFNHNLSQELRSVIGDDILDKQGAMIQLRNALEAKPSSRAVLSTLGGIGGAALGMFTGGPLSGAGGLLVGNQIGAYADKATQAPATKLNLAKLLQDAGSKAPKLSEIARGARPYLQSLLGQ